MMVSPLPDQYPVPYFLYDALTSGVNLVNALGLETKEPAVQDAGGAGWEVAVLEGKA